MARMLGACAAVLVALSPAVARAVTAAEWGWMEPSRVWEASRRVFLQPESWLQPDPEGCGTAACALDLAVAGELQGIAAGSPLASQFHDGQRFTAEGRLHADGTFELTTLGIGGEPDGSGRPTKLVGPDLDGAGSDVAIEELVLDGEGLEPEGGESGGAGPSADLAVCPERRCLAIVVQPRVLLSAGAAGAVLLSPSIRLVFADDAGSLSLSNLHERRSNLRSVEVPSIAVSAGGRSEVWRATVSAVRLVAAPRYGRELLRATFDGDAPGSPPSPWPAGGPPGDAVTLQNGSSGGNAILVQGPSAGFAGNSVRLVKAAGEGHSPVLEGHPDPALGPHVAGRYRVSWRSLAEAVQHYGFAAIVAPGNYPAFTLNYSMTGALVLQDGTGVVETGVAYAPGAAQRFEAVVDLDARTFDLWVDGVRVGAARPFQHPGFTALDRFYWEIGGVDAEAYAIADVRASCFAFSDVTPPVTTVSLSPGGNALGWSREPVSVIASAADGCAGSGVREVHLAAGGAETVSPGAAASIEVAAEGETALSAYALDRAGNRGLAQGAAATVRIDRGAPVIAFDGTCPGTSTLGAAATLHVAVSDGTSGVAAQSVANGPHPLATATVGTKAFTVTASDRAGNTAASTCTYRVIYDFVGAGGFAAPVRAPPAVNVVKAGSAVPLRWRLPDGRGGYVSDPGVVTSIRLQEAACQGFGPLESAWPVDAVASGASGLRYDPDANQFVFSWKTSAAMAGRCYVVTVGLDDGSEHRANLSVR